MHFNFCIKLTVTATPETSATGETSSALIHDDQRFNLLSALEWTGAMMVNTNCSNLASC